MEPFPKTVSKIDAMEEGACLRLATGTANAGRDEVTALFVVIFFSVSPLFSHTLSHNDRVER